MPESQTDKSDYNDNIAKGAVVNTLGKLGQLLIPVFFIVATRVYGPEILGLFYLAFTIMQVATRMTIGGINDAVLMFMSRDIEDEDKEDRLYLTIANGIVLSLVINVLMVIAAYAGGLELLAEKYPHKEVAQALDILIWAFPFFWLPIIIIAATKALLIMKWDAILLGFLQAFFLLVFSIGYAFFDISVASLVWSYFWANAIVTLISLYVFSLYFSYRKLFYHLLHFRFFWPMIHFSIPQNINITFTTFVTNVDVLMLGYFLVAPELISFYGMGAQIVRNLRQVKLAFSTIYMPVIARLHAQKRIEQLNISFSTVSRWTSLIGFPLAVLMMVFRQELLLIFHDSFTYDNTFMIVLVVIPLISVTLGLSANILVMTGHSTLNLINSIITVCLHFSLNYLLIPKYGLMGAAVGSVIGSFLGIMLYVGEIYFLMRIRLILSKIYKPYLAMAAQIGVWVLFAHLLTMDNFIEHLIVFLLSLAAYLGVLTLLKFEEEDKAIFKRKKQAV